MLFGCFTSLLVVMEQTFYHEKLEIENVHIDTNQSDATSGKADPKKVILWEAI